MINDVAYVGLGISSGQSLQGPELVPSMFYDFAISSDLYAEYRRPIIRKQILNENEIRKSQQSNRIHSRTDITTNFLAPYWHAYELSWHSYTKNQFVVNVGGDHSVAIASVAAFLNRFPDGVVIWVDAHADLNLPESSTTGNFHGMPLSLLLNLGDIGKSFVPWMNSFLKPQNLVYLGLRDIDPFEVHILQKLNIKYFSASEIQKIGMPSILKNISDQTTGRAIHVSVDVDGLDPVYAASTGLRIPNGLTVHDVCELMIWSSRQNLRSMDIVEINPNVGSERDVQQTFRSAAQILFSTLSQQNLSHQNIQGGPYDWIHRAHQKHNTNAFEWCS